MTLHPQPRVPFHSTPRWSYKGLGEPLCFVAFGPLATTAFYLTLASHQPALAPQAAAAAALAPATTAAAAAAASSSSLLQWAASIPSSVWISSVLVGITTTVILFCSHFHQIEGDIAAGKRSPLVRLGTSRGTLVLQAAVTAPYLIALAGAAAGQLPAAALVASVASLPAAHALVQYARDNHAVPALIAPLKRYAIKWHVAFGAALVVGLVGAGSGLGLQGIVLPK